MGPPSTASDRAVAWIAAGLAAVVVLMGGIFVAVGRHKRHRSFAALSWPSTAAVVTHSGWSSYRAPGESTPRQNSMTAFRYTVNGRTYEYRRSGFLGQRAPLAPGATVPVYFDPDDPSDFKLDFERGDPSRALEIVGALCALGSLPFWYLALRLYKRSRHVPGGDEPR